STLSDKDLKEITLSPARCPSCKFEAFLQEYYECNNCSKPNRATIFDVDMDVLRVAQGADNDKATVLQISQWSAPGPIDPKYTEAKPLPLDKIYAPSPLDVQAKQFRLPMPSPQLPAQQQPAQQPLQ